jgi:hypothetical protein
MSETAAPLSADDGAAGDDLRASTAQKRMDTKILNLKSPEPHWGHGFSFKGADFGNAVSMSFNVHRQCLVHRFHGRFL